MNERGKVYEELAAAYLRDQGYEIVAQNFSCRYGEIDIIAKENEILVFVEVKYRKSAGHGMPLEQITPRKQSKLRQAAQVYLAQFEREQPCRFDGIGILGSSIEHVKNIF